MPRPVLLPTYPLPRLRFRCVLRIRADDPDARVPLGLKYGASLEDVPILLQKAQALGLKVLGWMLVWPGLVPRAKREGP